MSTMGESPVGMASGASVCARAVSALANRRLRTPASCEAMFFFRRGNESQSAIRIPEGAPIIVAANMTITMGRGFAGVRDFGPLKSCISMFPFTVCTTIVKAIAAPQCRQICEKFDKYHKRNGFRQIRIYETAPSAAKLGSFPAFVLILSTLGC